MSQHVQARRRPGPITFLAHPSFILLQSAVVRDKQFPEILHKHNKKRKCNLTQYLWIILINNCNHSIQCNLVACRLSKVLPTIIQQRGLLVLSQH